MFKNLGYAPKGATVMVGNAVDTEAEAPILGPRGLAIPEATKLEEVASQNAASIVANPADQALIESLCNIGRSAQSSAAGEMDMLKVRVGDMLKNAGGDDSGIVRGLTDMRLRLREIDPFIASEIKWYQRAFSWFPGYNPMMEALLQIGARWETVQDQIHGIEGSLHKGQEALSKDVNELRNLQGRVLQRQKEVQANAYLAEILCSKIEDAIKSIVSDPVKTKKLQEVLYDVQLRVQALRKMEVVNEQFLAEIELTIKDNDKLIKSVDNTLQVVPNVLMVALSIQATLQRQRKIASATKALDEYASKVVVQTAEAVGKSGEEIDAIYGNSVIVMEQLMVAQRTLIEAMDKQDQNRVAAIESGKKIISQLESSSTELRERREGKSTTAVAVNSLEANITA
jgi:uncharacterized protein YaaN involved in tellurite resistance